MPYVRLSSKALAFRQKLLGSRLKAYDYLCQVVTFLETWEDLSSSM